MNNKESKERRETKLKQALREGVVDYKCPKCGKTIRAEPDNETPWCSNCEENVRVNPVI